MTPSERLLFLADALEADADNPKGMKFDLHTWAKSTNELVISTQPLGIDCGTVGCAMGLAMFLPELQAEGLKPIKYGHSSDRLYPSVGVDVVGEPLGPFESACKFFDITIGVAHHFFHAETFEREQRRGASAEREVARRIRSFVATGEINDANRETIVVG